jgi:hypothetical protein
MEIGDQRSPSPSRSFPGSLRDSGPVHSIKKKKRIEDPTFSTGNAIREEGLSGEHFDPGKAIRRPRRLDEQGCTVSPGISSIAYDLFLLFPFLLKRAEIPKVDVREPERTGRAR